MLHILLKSGMWQKWLHSFLPLHLLLSTACSSKARLYWETNQWPCRVTDSVQQQNCCDLVMYTKYGGGGHRIECTWSSTGFGNTSIDVECPHKWSVVLCIMYYVLRHTGKISIRLHNHRPASRQSTKLSRIIHQTSDLYLSWQFARTGK